jgi:hypothetical protein
LAAKLVGMLFLAFVLPPAFRVLTEPGLRGGDGFSGTTPTSQHMVELSAGYFIYDLIVCLLKLSGAPRTCRGLPSGVHACAPRSTASFAA